MRVAFFGSTRFSCIVLKELLASTHQVVGAVTQPDQPAGRRLTLCPTPVCAEALDAELPVLKPERVRGNPEFRRALAALRPEAFLLASFGQLISKKVLALTEWPLNVHPSALPRLRGSSPTRTALLEGLSATECCIMRMTPRLDDGDVLVREPLAIPRDWNFEDLINALGPLGGRLAVRALDQVEAGTAVLTPQDHGQATYCGMYTRDDTVIDWSRPAAQLANFIRAWDPDVGALTTLPDGRRLKVWRAAAEAQPPDAVGGEALPPPPWAPGLVLAVTKNTVLVATGAGALRLREIQPENKSRMTVGSYLAGNQLAAGERLGQ